MHLLLKVETALDVVPVLQMGVTILHNRQPKSLVALFCCPYFLYFLTGKLRLEMAVAHNGPAAVVERLLDRHLDSAMHVPVSERVNLEPGEACLPSQFLHFLDNVDFSGVVHHVQHVHRLHWLLHVELPNAEGFRRVSHIDL